MNLMDYLNSHALRIDVISGVILAAFMAFLLGMIYGMRDENYWCNAQMAYDWLNDHGHLVSKTRNAWLETVYVVQITEGFEQPKMAGIMKPRKLVKYAEQVGWKRTFPERRD